MRVGLTARPDFQFDSLVVVFPGDVNNDVKAEMSLTALEMMLSSSSLVHVCVNTATIRMPALFRYMSI